MQIMTYAKWQRGHKKKKHWFVMIRDWDGDQKRREAEEPPYMKMLTRNYIGRTPSFKVHHDPFPEMILWLKSLKNCGLDSALKVPSGPICLCTALKKKKEIIHPIPPSPICSPRSNNTSSALLHFWSLLVFKNSKGFCFSFAHSPSSPSVWTTSWTINNDMST